MVRYSAREDVALADAMLLWNDAPASGSSKDVSPPVIVSQGMPSGGFASYDNSTGACFDYWQAASDPERLNWLFRDAWMAVVRDGVEPRQMQKALLVVPEFRALFHPSDVPEAYRVDQ